MRPTTRTELQREREPEQLQLVPLWKSPPRKQRHGGETPWMMWPATAPSMETPCLRGIEHRQPCEIE